MKQKLFDAYFTKCQNPSDHEVLVAAAAEVGLEPVEARKILSSNRYAKEVRAAEHLWQSRGISAVAAVVTNEKYLISGGQPPKALGKALRGIAAEAARA